jgi:hypothetical protein
VNQEALAHWGLLRQKKKSATYIDDSTVYQKGKCGFVMVTSLEGNIVRNVAL